MTDWEHWHLKAMRCLLPLGSFCKLGGSHPCLAEKILPALYFVPAKWQGQKLNDRLAVQHPLQAVPQLLLHGKLLKAGTSSLTFVKQSAF